MAHEAASILIAMALPAESAGVFESAGIDVLYTGVGKVNAAVALMRRVVSLRRNGREPALVVNFGTAGSARLPARSLVACRRFVDRDMDVGALGFAPGVTPFDALPAMLECAAYFPELPEAVCGSGDSFATTDHGPDCDVVDMEAYALAKTCRIEAVPFACAKYVTDGADEHAARHWKENVAGAAASFLALYRGLVTPPAASRA
jgi:adenosylhomocysteine nucleosidase